MVVARPSRKCLVLESQYGLSGKIIEFQNRRMGGNIQASHVYKSPPVVGYSDHILTLPRLTIKLNLESEGGVNIQLVRINHRAFGGPRL